MVPNINENGRWKNFVLNYLVQNCPKFQNFLYESQRQEGGCRHIVDMITWWKQLIINLNFALKLQISVDFSI